MLQLIAKVDWTKVGDSVFITLTYPDEVADLGQKQRALHRQRFFKNIEDYIGTQVAVMWKTEWQPRKTGIHKGELRPHYHLMVLDVRYIPYDEVRAWWRHILQVEGYLATDVRRITGPQGAGKYLAKYVSKSSSLDNVLNHNGEKPSGRMWGLTRPSLVPMARVECDRELTAEEVQILQASQQKLKADYDPLLGNGFTGLGKKRKAILLRGLPDFS